MAFANPSQIVEHLYIEPGMVVADLGAGAGFYTVLLADKVGDEGKVYAIDIQADLLTKAKSLDNVTRTNIEFLHGDLEEEKGTHLAADTIDLAVMVNVLFQLEDRAAGLAEAFRILHRGGQLFLSDWTDSFGGLGPQEEYVVDAQQGRELAESVGFAFEKELSVGDHHWGAIFIK
jgi:ubiquinone/menaquinone biosynthesis C-methylase UbiE